MKKIVIFLIVIILLLTLFYYKYKNETVECWWGVIYPTLSFIGFEDNQEIASLNDMNIDNNIHIKFAFIEWLKKIHSGFI